MFGLLLFLVVAPLVWGSVITPPRVAGGRNASIEEFPYTVAFELRARLWCGAILIKEDVALTAAHCGLKVLPDIAKVQIRAGSSIRDSGGQTVGVKKIIVHPKYDKPDYDVAVVLLAQPVTLSPSVRTIPLQAREDEVPVGTVGTITGWGSLIHGGTPSKFLQAVEVPRIDDATCAVYYEDEDVTDRMMCFGFAEGEKDACHGDSGGPLAANGKLVGVISWGYGCAIPEWPGVYAKISHPEIYDFIKPHL